MQILRDLKNPLNALESVDLKAQKTASGITANPQEIQSALLRQNEKLDSAFEIFKTDAAKGLKALRAAILGAQALQVFDAASFNGDAENIAELRELAEKAPALEADAVQDNDDEPAGYNPVLHSSEVWIVDGNDMIRRLLNMIFSNAQAGKIRLFSSASEAWNAFTEAAQNDKSNLPDVVLTDYMTTPEMTGEQLLENIQNWLTQNPDTKIGRILQSGGAVKDGRAVNLAAVARKNGAAFVAKPYSGNVIVSEAIKGLAARSESRFHDEWQAQTQNAVKQKHGNAAEWYQGDNLIAVELSGEKAGDLRLMRIPLKVDDGGMSFAVWQKSGEEWQRIDNENPKQGFQLAEFKSSKFMHLRQIYLKVTAQNQGAGGMLLDWMRQRFDRLGLTQLIFTTSSSNLLKAVGNRWPAQDFIYRIGEDDRKPVIVGQLPESVSERMNFVIDQRNRSEKRDSRSELQIPETDQAAAFDIALIERVQNSGDAGQVTMALAGGIALLASQNGAEAVQRIAEFAALASPVKAGDRAVTEAVKTAGEGSRESANTALVLGYMPDEAEFLREWVPVFESKPGHKMLVLVKGAESIPDLEAAKPYAKQLQFKPLKSGNEIEGLRNAAQRFFGAGEYGLVGAAGSLDFLSTAAMDKLRLKAISVYDKNDLSAVAEGKRALVLNIQATKLSESLLNEGFADDGSVGSVRRYKMTKAGFDALAGKIAEAIRAQLAAAVSA